MRHLSLAQRYTKGIRAGVDQFGSTGDISPLVGTIRAGTLPMERIDGAVTDRPSKSQERQVARRPLCRGRPLVFAAGAP